MNDIDLAIRKSFELIKGCIDLHVHSGPGVQPRPLDHVEAARQCIASGMRGLIVKDHYFTTCNQVYFINKYILKDAPISIFGGLVLNNASGGLNPKAVATAIEYGAKIIWMPTLSAKNHIEYHKTGKSIHSEHKRTEVEEVPLTVLDDKGILLPQVVQICQLIAKADIILATGHLNINEINPLVDEAIKQGVKKILINHPEFIVGASIEDMITLASKGVFIEHSYTLMYSKKMTNDRLFEMIRKVGAERTIIASDMGQVGRPLPVDGLKKFIQDMLLTGLKDEEINLVLRVNPSNLLNLN
jgi:hypothetical protein